MSSLLVALLFLADVAASAPAVAPAEAPAAGRHQATVTVPAFGRYAITVKSEEGASLLLVDRMAGPGEPDGSPGEYDGRLDPFLDRGEYRVIVDGHERAKGAAKVAVHAFRELHQSPPLLVEGKPVQDALADFEQRSYWLQVDEARTVALEAAGRSLADLRLWRDGTWLVDAAPQKERVQPKVGQPLTVCRLATPLEPGLYLLTAYGGPALPWAEDDGRQPFHLRAGLPLLPEAGRRRFTVSPFGVDRYRLPGNTTFVRVELPEAKPVTLTAASYQPESPFASGDTDASITKESLPPVAELDLDRRTDGDQVVTVSGEAGQPYVLQQFHAAQRWNPVPSGALWLGTVHAGAPEDSIDASGVLARKVKDDRLELVDADVAHLDDSGAFVRRANLLSPLSLVLQLAEAGTYEVQLGGVAAQARLEPVLLTYDSDYRSPLPKPSGGTWELDAGYYLLTVLPVEKGVVDITVTRKTVVGNAMAAAGLAARPVAHPVRAALRFPHETGADLLFVGLQPSVRVGLIARALPVDLTDALFVAQQPGEAVTVPFAAREKGTLSALAEDGSALEVSLDGGAWAKSVAVAAGTHQAAVRHDRPATTAYSLALVPDRLRADTPLPPLPDSAHAAIPQFPVLVPGTPQFLDLDRTRQATFKLAVAEPALYELSTTGLLATEAAVRTRTAPQLAQGEENGVGRNASVRAYLREGDYQMTVATRGLTRGHLGVQAQRVTLVPGGFLTNTVPARITLQPGQAVAYRFNITKPGRFHLRALGLGRTLHARLEDLDGWPVVAPGGEADITEDLPPGKYRFIVLPEVTEARVVSLIEPLAPPVQRAGHGPLPLRLGARQSHLWTEPEGDAPRTPDSWTLDVPAPIDARIELTGDMQGELIGSTGSSLAFVPPGRGWSGPLAAGRYRLDLVSSRVDNRSAYTVAVWPDQLVAGLSREATPPLEIPVSIGEAGLYELSTFGPADVALRLLDGSGRQLAADDDRPDDWNAHLALPLQPGAYRLRVDRVGSGEEATRVSLRRPQEKVQPALVLPAALDASLRASAWVWPLTLPAGAEVVSATAQATETVGLALEAEVAGAWRTVASDASRHARVDAAVSPTATAWRLRAWSLDRRDSPVHVVASGLAPETVPEKTASAGTALRTGAARLDLVSPGVLRVGGGVRVCAQPLVACVLAEAPVAVPGRSAWVLGEAGATVKAERVVLRPGEPLTVGTPAGARLTIDVADAAGPRVLRADAREGQPAVALGDAAFVPLALAAVTGTLDTSVRTATAWPAADDRPQDVRLTLQAASPAPSTESLHDGAWEAQVPAGAARAVDLGGEPRRLRLALDAGLVALLTRGHDVVAVVGGGSEAVAETLETTADRVTVVPLQGEGRAAVEAVAAPATLTVARGRALQLDQPASGTLRVQVTAAAGERVHVRGASGDPLLQTGEGRVWHGRDLASGGSGLLRIAHGPGLLLAWVDAAEDDGPWTKSAGTSPSATLKLPASTPLGGATQSIAIELREPAMLHAQAPARSATVLRRPGFPADVRVHESGTRVDAYAPAGRTELQLHALGGALTGALDITATPVTTVGEGLGPEVLLAPGSARLFAFEVTHEGPIGIGVSASADTVDATLTDAAGRSLGTGAAQMPTLAPGHYLLALSARADGPTVRARAALAGLVAPDTGPPAEVARQYLQPQEEQAPEFTAHRSATPWGTEAIEEDEGGDETPSSDDTQGEEDDDTGNESGDGGRL